MATRPASRGTLQRSRGRMTPETSLPPRRWGERQASTEPGLDDPGDRVYNASGGRGSGASTEPGPDDPGDWPSPAHHYRRSASTEPGLDHPGADGDSLSVGAPTALQRSRGRMTPETARHRIPDLQDFRVDFEGSGGIEQKLRHRDSCPRRNRGFQGLSDASGDRFSGEHLTPRHSDHQISASVATWNELREVRSGGRTERRDRSVPQGRRC